MIYNLFLITSHPKKLNVTSILYIFNMYLLKYNIILYITEGIKIKLLFIRLSIKRVLSFNSLFVTLYFYRCNNQNV